MHTQRITHGYTTNHTEIKHEYRMENNEYQMNTQQITQK